MIQLGDHFRRDDRVRYPEELRQKKWFVKARQERKRREEIADRAEDDLTTLAADVALATPAQINRLKVRLDHYDEATVIALMENQKKLDAINATLQAMLEQAYVMEDGRRVFMTEDRTRVFDELGQEVTADELDFNMIGPDNPTWEEFDAGQTQLLKYKTERRQILDYQKKLDEAREKLSGGEISKDDLDQMDKDLSGAMPPSVRRVVNGLDNADVAPKLKSEFASPAGHVQLTRSAARTLEPDPLA